MNEQDLIRQCQRSKSSAQKQLFDLYSDRFYRLAVRYLKDHAEAEDVVMMAFVKIFNAFKTYKSQGTGSLEGWMRKIVINEALMCLRKRHNFFLTESLNAYNPDHDLEIIEQADAEYLYQLILELPDGYRTVFNLFAIEGYEHREIATILGITEGTSRSQLYKAKELLKRRLGKEGMKYGT